MRTEIYTRGSGKTIRLMATVVTLTQTGLLTLVNGKMTSSTEKAWRHGQMEPSTRDNIMKAKNTARVL